MQLIFELTAGAVVFTGLLGASVLQAIRRRFVLLPQRGLRFVPIPGVTLPGDVAIKDWFIGRLWRGSSVYRQPVSINPLSTVLAVFPHTA